MLALVTSHFTLDKTNAATREYLGERADFLGAIRLPSDAFKREGTSVVTDILFLRKRRPGTPAQHADPAWLETGPLAVEGVEVRGQPVFPEPPGDGAGRVEPENLLHGKVGYSLKSTGDLATQLAAAIERLPKAQVVQSVARAAQPAAGRGRAGLRPAAARAAHRRGQFLRRR